MLETRTEKLLRRFKGEIQEGYTGKCTNCKQNMYDDCESYEDEDGNIFCSVECVLTHYGIKHNE